MSDAQRRYWDQVTPGYDQSMSLIGQAMPQMVALVEAATPDDARVLEVAAGTGLVTRALARRAREVIATDYAPAMVEALAERVRAERLDAVRVEVADLYALAYEPQSFDVVVAANVLHLVPELDAAIDALAAMARPGGKLILPTFCHDQTWRSRAVSRLMGLVGFPGQRRFALDSLQRALEARGLRVVSAQLVPGALPIGYVEAVVPA